MTLGHAVMAVGGAVAGGVLRLAAELLGELAIEALAMLFRRSRPRTLRGLEAERGRSAFWMEACRRGRVETRQRSGTLLRSDASS